MSLESDIGSLLKKKHFTLGTVESATGGLSAHRLTNISGSSDYFRGAIVSYSNEVKMSVVGVKKDTLRDQGAVSAETAQAMAEDGRKVLGVDICIADTGIAGPTGGSPAKPVGLFYLGLAYEGGVLIQKHMFYGDRGQNKQSAAEAALKWLKEYLTKLK